MGAKDWSLLVASLVCEGIVTNRRVRVGEVLPDEESDTRVRERTHIYVIR